jgi:thiol-disulfide isomerase/thioredoxin
MITTITNLTDFYDLLNNNIVIIYVYAEWSVLCKKINNIYFALSDNDKYKNILFLKVHTNYADKIFLYPTSIPAFYIFINTVKTDGYYGCDEKNFIKFLDKYV